MQKAAKAAAKDANEVISDWEDGKLKRVEVVTYGSDDFIGNIL